MRHEPLGHDTVYLTGIPDYPSGPRDVRRICLSAVCVEISPFVSHITAEIQMKYGHFLLVEHHPILRQGITAALHAAADLGQVCITEASSYAGAMSCIATRGEQFDLVLYDVDVPGGEGTSGLEALRSVVAPIPVAALGENKGCDEITAIYRSGAAGFFGHETSAEALARGLAVILRGGIFMPPTLLNDLLLAGQRGLASPGNLRTKSTVRQPARSREVAIFNLIRQGMANKDIAHRLQVSEGTVKAYVSNLLGRYGVQTRTQLIATSAFHPQHLCTEHA